MVVIGWSGLSTSEFIMYSASAFKVPSCYWRLTYFHSLHLWVLCKSHTKYLSFKQECSFFLSYPCMVSWGSRSGDGSVKELEYFPTNVSPTFKYRQNTYDSILFVMHVSLSTISIVIIAISNTFVLGQLLLVFYQKKQNHCLNVDSTSNMIIPWISRMYVFVIASGCCIRLLRY
jgi:hypothetical protein